MTIIDQIKQIVKITFKSERMYSELCTVVSVNETERTCICQPIDDSAQLQKVRLQSVKEQTTGLLIVPTVGSFVTVSFLDNRNGFISSTTEIDKILIDTDLVQFNQGVNDGLINITDLVTKLNDLKTEIQQELVKIQTGITGVGGAYTPGTLTAFNKNDFEDTKITH